MIAPGIVAATLDSDQSLSWVVLCLAFLILIWSFVMLLPANLWLQFRRLGHAAIADPSFGSGDGDPASARWPQSGERTSDLVLEACLAAGAQLERDDDAMEATPPPEPERTPEPLADAVEEALPFEAAQAEIARDSDGPEVRCRMDLAATHEGLELTVELPGLDGKDVQIEVVGELLTISGELCFSADRAGKSYRLTERTYGAFTRTIALPEGVQIDGIRADLSRGLLTVTIPNPVSPIPRRIEVQSAPMRLTETEAGLALTIDLPGLEQADVEVAVCEGVLSVSGGHGQPTSQPDFHRQVELPPGVDPGLIGAVMSKGVLTVSIPSPTRPDPKRIEVLAA